MRIVLASASPRRRELLEQAGIDFEILIGSTRECITKEEPGEIVEELSLAKAKGVAENIVAIDGIAVVVDPANTVEDLTKDQLTSIYDGTVTNWKDVGGNDAPIVVVGREAGSGTRGAFEELLKLEGKGSIYPRFHRICFPGCIR